MHKIKARVKKRSKWSAHFGNTYTKKREASGEVSERDLRL